MHDFLIIGGGIFGVTAARELHSRGYRVLLLDPGPLPSPLAASTDISKVVRMEYGADRIYMRMVDQAIDGWHAWNDEFGSRLYHQTGVVMLTRRPMERGAFEFESYQALLALGHSPERVDSTAIGRRFPQWNSEVYQDGFFHARAGFVESGRVVATLIDRARDEGVVIEEGRLITEIERSSGRVAAVVDENGKRFAAGHIVVCAGAWTHGLLPELQPVMRSTGHPVFHLRPRDASAFVPPEFPVFTADIAATGWYGFPLHPSERVIKIANHGVGQPLHPSRDARVVGPEETQRFRAFLAETFPALADAEITSTRRCLYNDTLDEHLWIDRHPDLANLTVGAGGSGHALKLAPRLGAWIADAAEGCPNTDLDRFRWRELDTDTGGREEARCHWPPADATE